MRDTDIRTLVLLYTQDAADAKDAVGARLFESIKSEPQPEKTRKPVRRWVRAAVLMLAIGSMLMFTSYGQALADFVYENIIQRLFPPAEAEIIVEGEPDLKTVYPFGEVVESDAVGHASYVIYLEDQYSVVQEENKLRVFFELEGWTAEEEARRRDDMAEFNYTAEEVDRLIEEQRVYYEAYIASLPPVSLEITQQANVTVDEVVARLSAEREFGSVYEPSEEFPYASLHYNAGYESTSEVGAYYVRDNLCGGVIFIKTTYSFEAAEGHGARLAQAIGSLEIIEYDIGSEK